MPKPTLKKVMRTLSNEIEIARAAGRTESVDRLEALARDIKNIAMEIVSSQGAGVGFSSNWENLTLDHPKFSEAPMSECISLLEFACEPQTVSQDVKVVLDGEEFLLEKGDTVQLNIINEIIKKVKGGYKVLSHKKGKDGKRKNLGGPYASKAQAHKRLGQVEYFKKHKG